MTFASTNVSPRPRGSITTPATLRPSTSWTWDATTTRQSWPWYMYMFVCTCFLLACWFVILWVSSLTAVSSIATTRLVDQCCTAAVVVVASALLYACLSWLLMHVPTTADFGFKLWSRLFHLSMTSPSIHHPLDDGYMRPLIEICTWVAIVLGTYVMYRKPVVAVLVGGISGIWVVAVGDFFVVYVRIHSEFQRRQHHDENAASPWRLQYAITTVSLGYMVLGVVRLVYSLIPSTTSVDDDDDGQKRMAWQYLLSVLMGVSLIVTSELLMLYEPTWHAGMVLQARVVNAKANWMVHPVRSMAEVAFVCGVAVIVNDYTDNMVLSLQLGTVICTCFVLCGEYVVYPTLRGNSFDELNAPTMVPRDDHWIKVLPLLSLAAFMLYYVGRLVVAFVFVGHSDMLTSVVVPSLLDLTLLAVVSRTCRLSVVWSQMVSLPRHSTLQPLRTSLVVLAHVCFVVLLRATPTTTHLPRWAHSVATLMFDIALVYMQLLGPAIWDAVYSVEYATSWKIQVDLHRAMSCTISDSTTRHLIWDVPDELSVEQGHDQHEPGPRQHNLSHGIRASTLINVCVAGIIMPVAGWRYGYSLLHRLSGVSAVLAISVLLASCSGVLIGVLTCSTHPKFRLFRRVLVLVVTQQFVLHPVQVFVQAVVCVGVLVGTYATSGSWSTSVLLAATSLATVMGGSHWVVRGRFVLTAATSSVPSSDQSTVAVLAFMAVLLTYAVGLSLFVIYYHIADRIEVAFCLATLSGVVFVAASELCIMWAPTRAAGIVLQTRVTHCLRNWQLEPLRSFLEFFVWLGVTYGTFVLYQDVVVALHLGTLSGIVVTLAGEVFRSRWWHPFPISGASGADSPPDESSVHQQRPKVLPLLLLFAYVGAGTFQWIFEHLRRLEVTVVLATVAGIVFLCVADVLAMWQPTRWAGVILQDRFLNASEHWQVHPVRSFVESGCFLGVIYGSHAIYGDLTVAVQCGTLSGMLVTLIGEQLKSRRRTNLLAHSPTISGICLWNL
ncbi:hypothetical protein, variant [Aphanomyces astaci]|uniref:Uncharacterized protein n=1 Tax=Aphanomyces astaci TaxID=112090 RepID=W4G3C9_APHAT|nr:hypothetical protein, variant [Aphanomyces astaci]ETV73791.1 hypothetical protein, variant [Aphanomyces astaci]|eukprot:XP_009836726.1 hypothetical protein, variant [Aphanomyces astaci]